MGVHYIIGAHTKNNKIKMYSLFTACKFSKLSSKKGHVGFKANPYPYTLG